MLTPTETPPEGLLPWIREQKDIQWPDWLIYRAGRWTDPMTGMKEKCVDAVCTACGQSMKLEYKSCGKYQSAPFGFGWTDGDAVYEGRSQKKICCPRCGKTVTALHIGSARDAARYAWPISLEARGHALILYLWRVCRRADKAGEIHWDAIPWEAYVYDQGRAQKWVHWTKTLGGATCLLQKWQSRVKLTDTVYDVDIVFCPEGIERACMGTCMENSKLQEYMAITSEYRFPVTWLRLYQRFPNLENLMTCPAAKLTAGMIAEQKRATSYYHVWNTNTDLLKEMARTKARPWDILRIRKDELAYFTAMETKDGTERLQTLQLMRKKGFKVRVGEEDPAWIGSSLREFLQKGIDPRKVKTYMDRQKRKYPKDNAGYYMLSDYWNAAEYLGIDLEDKELRWPQRLKTAHDTATELRRIQQDEERKRRAAEEAARMEESFRSRFEKMSRYAWERDGILIRPARSEQELSEEGKTLHHCVATYAKRHAAGELTIFFIRHTTEPDKPWYTLNFNEKKMSVTENRGDHNCPRTEEIQAFEDAWIEWARAGAKRNEKKEVVAA